MTWPSGSGSIYTCLLPGHYQRNWILNTQLQVVHSVVAKRCNANLRMSTAARAAGSTARSTPLNSRSSTALPPPTVHAAARQRHMPWSYFALRNTQHVSRCVSITKQLNLCSSNIWSMLHGQQWLHNDVGTFTSLPHNASNCCRIESDGTDEKSY